MVGVTSVGAYLPRRRLQRASIVAANAWFDPSLAAPGQGERTMCGWDEDSVTMAAAALRDMPKGQTPAWRTRESARNISRLRGSAVRWTLSASARALFLSP